jgi:multicomponent K+:H+ antiporter subunit G
MSSVNELPGWASIVVGLLVLFGSLFTFIGGLGVLRFKTFYQRVHAPTLGSSFGVASIVLAHILCMSLLRGRVALGAALVFIFVILTVPVGLLLLARAALVRDEAEGSPDPAIK